MEHMTPNEISQLDSLLSDIFEDANLETSVLRIPLFESLNATINVFRLDRLGLKFEHENIDLCDRGHVSQQQIKLRNDKPRAVSYQCEESNGSGLNGNKLFKLLPNLLAAKAAGKDTLLTFGGAWSNHLYSTAKAAAESQLKSIGIVRGERPSSLTPTLCDARSAGMDLIFVPRSLYRTLCKVESKEGKEYEVLCSVLGSRINETHIVPEGGSNELGVLGAKYIGKLMHKQVKDSKSPLSQIWLPAATGGTLLGFLAGICENHMHSVQTVGVKVLENPNFSNELCMLEDTARLKGIVKTNSSAMHQLLSISNGSCGGYAKVDKEYAEFYTRLGEQLPFPVDHVYMGKVFFALWKELHMKSNAELKNIAILHTGGIQGRRGYSGNAPAGDTLVSEIAD